MKKLIQVVVIAAIKHKGKYLLTKRYEPRSELTHNKWQMPGGGLEFKETVIECLHREVFEETNLKIKVFAMVPFIDEKILFKAGWHTVAAAFLCKPIENNPIVKLDKEASDFGWFSYKDAIQLPLHHGTADVIHHAERVKLKLGVEERT